MAVFLSLLCNVKIELYFIDASSSAVTVQPDESQDALLAGCLSCCLVFPGRRVVGNGEYTCCLDSRLACAVCALATLCSVSTDPAGIVDGPGAEKSCFLPFLGCGFVSSSLDGIAVRSGRCVQPFLAGV